MLNLLLAGLAIFVVSVVALFGLAWLSVVLAYFDADAHDDLLTDGENFEHTTTGRNRR